MFRKYEANSIFSLGVITGTHGIKGEVKLRAKYAEFAFVPGTKLIIAGQEYTLRSGRPHKTNILLTLQEIPDCTAAEKLRGAEVFSAERPDRMTVFAEDILGKTVLDRGREIGTVMDILQTPVHNVLVIKQDGREILVPQIDKFILEISDTITADLSDL